ncbi:hypothetical protein CGGC5_v013051 [Colletotrichum fructicola Nara gc5]|uniref:Uncharacterized protein n=1 Tax=Colletotrichum fructicola (strain Nara gc5) TaxID=1213859 RepID=A0A7J6INW3_COLFN|nr:hypothetical protein CGGC5_v013087 [Colletotrichum fructicola Nara gc5]KAF4478232.1 hypothetical protein CGGC5_v013051 [Colletotrichum fructicola Nara gc5]
MPAWTTNRTSGTSIPNPNAFVTTMTPRLAPSPLLHASNLDALSSVLSMLLWNAAHPNASAIRSTPSIVLLYTTALPRGCCRNQSLTSWQPRSSTALNSPSSPSRPDPNPNPDFARRLWLAAPQPRPRPPPPDPNATTTTPYSIFLRVVASRNTRTRSGRIPVTAKNSRSSAGGNVAVKHTNCAPNSCTVRPNARNAGRNPLDPSNTTWHSSNTTRSNLLPPLQLPAGVG